MTVIFIGYKEQTSLVNGLFFVRGKIFNCVISWSKCIVRRSLWSTNL